MATIDATYLGRRRNNERNVVPFVFALACAVSGCTGGSIHPLLRQAELNETCDLSGTWRIELADGQNADKQLLVELHRYDTGTYDVDLHRIHNLASDRGREIGLCKVDAWTLQIGKLNGEVYGQIVPRDPPMGPPLLCGVPVYVFGRLAIEKDELLFFPLLDLSRSGLAEREQFAHVSYRISEFYDLKIFAMPTVELQQAVVAHRQVLFNPKPWVLRRVAPAQEGH